MNSSSRAVAAIWIPSHVDPIEPHVMACLNHACQHDYDLLGIITAAPWNGVRQMMVDGKVDVVVVSDLAHLPADRTPRLEVAGVGEAMAPAAPTPAAIPCVVPRQRRPRRRS